VPKEILVPALPSDPNDVHVLTEWLSLMRGSNVSLRVAQRGDKATLAQTVTRNAEQALVIHKTKRASDLSTRGQALEQIAEALGLDEVPLRIECYDISNLGPTDTVGSMVVFEDGRPAPASHRHFGIKTVEGSNDVASILWPHPTGYMTDMAKAKALVAASGTKGEKVAVYTETVEPVKSIGEYIQSVMNQLGYKTTIKALAHGPYCTTGSPIGLPPSSSRSKVPLRLSCRGLPSTRSASPAPRTASWPDSSGTRSAPTVPKPPSA